jgi:hyperosmotically inducible protein
MTKLSVIPAVILAVGLAGCAAMTGRSAGRTIDDATISASVKSKLAADAGAKTLTSVDVDTVNGTVYLSGTVPDAATKERAARLAREVDGAQRVVNNLQTRSSMAGDDPDKSDGGY